MKFQCPVCNFQCRVDSWPFHCICGCTFKAADASGACSHAQPRNDAQQGGLTAGEVSSLFGSPEDKTLLGNRIAALTAAVGIPACGGCKRRKEWFNRAHQWVRANITASD